MATFTECFTFTILDTLHAIAMGADQLSAWILCIDAPFFASAIFRIFNLSLQHSFVPSQCNAAIICLISNVTNPTIPSDFRPIFITPWYLAQYSSRTIIHHIDALCFTESSTAALIAILVDLTWMLKCDLLST